MPSKTLVGIRPVSVNVRIESDALGLASVMPRISSMLSTPMPDIQTRLALLAHDSGLSWSPLAPRVVWLAGAC